VVQKTHEFFERYGARAVILARFVPILRALVPMLAGISKMDHQRFTRLNLVGATVWVLIFMIPGYWLGGIELVRENLEITVLAIVIGTSLLLPLEILRDRISKQIAKRKLDAK
jgi:membrane-associated protein